MKLNVNQNMKINDAMSCYANLHSVSDLQISMGKYEPKRWPECWVYLIWNFVKGFPL